MPRTAFLVWNALAALASTCVAVLGAYGIGSAVVGRLSARRGAVAIAPAALALAVLAVAVWRRRGGRGVKRAAREPPGTSRAASGER
jgi:membrane protein DedA with SNARE-associated domain